MTPVHVNIASDESEGFSTHVCIPPMPSPTMPSHEVRIPHAWAAGAGKHKIAAKVFHKTKGIVLHGHDCGAGIPDEAPPYMTGCNAWLPCIMLKSSRKVMFAASSVKAEGTPVGGATRSPDLPMLSCGEPVPLPRTYPALNILNTVLVGLSARDVEYGWQDIEDTIAIEAALFVVAVITMDPRAIAGDVLDGVIGRDPKKTALSAAVGLKRSIERSRESGWKEPIVLKAETGGGAIGGGVEVKYTPATGEAEASGEVAGFSEKKTYGVKRDVDGKLTGTGSVPPDLFD